ncbi:hypothetical protein SGPA1_50723 [Streptomyces misionensis JCM 4497]
MGLLLVGICRRPRPLERRVDSLFRVHTVGDDDGFLLAVESQGKPDPDKHNSWT